MNRYNHLTGQRMAPNSFPAQQPIPYNNTYYPNNMHHMPPPHPLPPQRHGGNFRRRPSNQPNQPPQAPMMFRGQNVNEAPPQEKKGLLSKLFRNSNKRQPPPTAQTLFSLPPSSARGVGSGVTTAATQAAATTAASGGILQSLVNPANLTTMLNNTQRVLQAAESIGPLVQQYGPFVKNIPSMWKLVQGMTTTDTDQNEKKDNNNQNVPVKEAMTPTQPNNVEPAVLTTKPIAEPIHKNVHIRPLSPEPSRPVRQYAKGESIPKLFI